MKILQIFVLCLGLIVFTNAQKTLLTGTVYDSNGALIVNANIKAVNENGKEFKTLTNDEGTYSLNLPYNKYDSSASFRVTRYEIVAESRGFERFVLKDFKLVPAYKGKMNLDIALDGQTAVDTAVIDLGKNNKNIIKRKNK